MKKKKDALTELLDTLQSAIDDENSGKLGNDLSSNQQEGTAIGPDGELITLGIKKSDKKK